MELYTEFIKSGMLSLKNIVLICLLILFVTTAKSISDFIKKFFIKLGNNVINLFDGDRKKKKKRLAVNIDLGEKINELLTEIMAVFGCDRVYVVSYHNSIVLANGVHWFFASVISEVSRKGMIPFFTNFREMPVSLFAHFNKRIQNHEFVYNDDTSLLCDKDCATYETMLASSTKSNYAYGLFDYCGCTGFLCIDYCVEKHKLTEYNQAKLIEYANKISICLDLKRK